MGRFLPMVEGASARETDQRQETSGDLGVEGVTATEPLPDIQRGPEGEEIADHTLVVQWRGQSDAELGGRRGGHVTVGGAQPGERARRGGKAGVGMRVGAVMEGVCCSGGDARSG
jgi:hypothetical protein